MIGATTQHADSDQFHFCTTASKAHVRAAFMGPANR